MVTRKSVSGTRACPEQREGASVSGKRGKNIFYPEYRWIVGIPMLLFDCNQPWPCRVTSTQASPPDVSRSPLTLVPSRCSGQALVPLTLFVFGPAPAEPQTPGRCSGRTHRG